MDGFPAVTQRYRWWLGFSSGKNTKQTNTPGCLNPSGDERLPRATPVVVSGVTVKRNPFKKEYESGLSAYT